MPLPTIPLLQYIKVLAPGIMTDLNTRGVSSDPEEDDRYSYRDKSRVLQKVASSTLWKSLRDCRWPGMDSAFFKSLLSHPNVWSSNILSCCHCKACISGVISFTMQYDPDGTLCSCLHWERPPQSSLLEKARSGMYLVTNVWKTSVQSHIHTKSRLDLLDYFPAQIVVCFGIGDLFSVEPVQPHSNSTSSCIHARCYGAPAHF